VHTKAAPPISEMCGKATESTGGADALGEAGVMGVLGPGMGLGETDIRMEFFIEGVQKVSHLNSQSINRL
jgi:hypothetical protein